MPNFPNFRKGLNRLDTQLLRRIGRMLVWWEQNRERIELKHPRRPASRSRASSPDFTCLIRSNPTAIGPNRWLYGWDEAQLSVGGVYTVTPGGRNSDDLGMAYNRVESHNNGANLEGYGVTVTIPPEAGVDVDVTMFPILAGATVLMRLESFTRQGTGNQSKTIIRPMFSAPNEIFVGVTCEVVPSPL